MQINVKHEDRGESRLKVDLEIPFTELEQEYNTVRKDFIQHAQLPGFRKGKVPTAMIEKKFKPSIQGQVIENILPKAWAQAVKENSLQTFGQPTAEKISDYEDGKPLTVEFSVDKMPSCNIKNYKSIVVTRDEIDIQDSDVDEEVRRMLRSRATMEPSDKPAAEGDFVKIDIKVLTKGEESSSAKDYPVELNSSNPVPFDLLDEFIGIETGKAKKCKKKFAKDFRDKRVAGKEIEFELTASEVRKIIMPELTDDLAKELKYDNIADLKAQVKKSLDNAAEGYIRNAVKKQALDQLRKNVDFVIPESVISYTTQQYLNNLKRQFGNNEEFFNAFIAEQQKQGKDYLKEYQEVARFNIENDLIIQKVIDDNKIEVDEDKMKGEIEKIATAQKQDPKATKKDMIKSGAYTNLKNDLKERMAVEYIIAQGSVKKGKKLDVAELYK